MNIEIKNLIKNYEDKEILKIDSLNLKDINTLAIIGPSGGGKSTLLKILSTIEEAEADEIKVNGIDITNKNNHEDYLKEVGYVFQHNNLFPNLTVLENITIHLIYTFNMEKEKAEAKAKEWLEKIGIYDQKDKYPNQISGGQAQRAAIIRALINDAKLLLLDEPTSALDPKLAYEVMQTLMYLKDFCHTIIVTHELNFARKFADYFIFVDEGKIIYHGSINELDTVDNENIRSFMDMIKFK